jgi:thermitase
MKTTNWRAITLVFLLVLSTIAVTLIETRHRAYAQKAHYLSEESFERFVPNRILVKFHDGILPDHARNVIAALGARDADEIPGIGVHILDLPSQADERAFVSAFQRRAEVEFAELDRILQPADVTPNDPWYAGGEWHLPKISAASAWSTTTGSAEVIVAILDSGVDNTHEDLADNMVPGWNIYNNNSDTSDVNGHGTNVAGAAAARSNNALGVASVCWNCKIMPVRITDSTGYSTYSAVASGLNWATDHGARVANISFIVSDSSTVTTAAKYFQSKGGVVAVSAGNYSTFDSTADNPYMLTVSATDIYDAHSDFSNYGNNIDVSAPEAVYTTVRGGGYMYAGGTSFSAPIVAGVAALVMSVNPSLTGSQVQDVVKQSADDLGTSGWDVYFGWGRVNAARAVTMAGGAPQPTASPTPTPIATPSPTPTPSADTTAPSVTITSPSNGSKVGINTSVYVDASDNVGVMRVELYVDGVLAATSTSAPFTTKWNTKKATVGTHALQTKAYDAAGNSGTSTSVSVYK